jgi:hypothetical protein
MVKDQFEPQAWRGKRLEPTGVAAAAIPITRETSAETMLALADVVWLREAI